MLSFAFLSFLPFLHSLFLPVARLRRSYEFHLFRSTQNDTWLTVIRRTLVFKCTNTTLGFVHITVPFFKNCAVLIYCVLSCRIIASASLFLAERALVTRFSVKLNRMEFRLHWLRYPCPGERASDPWCRDQKLAASGNDIESNVTSLRSLEVNVRSRVLSQRRKKSQQHRHL